MTERRSEKPEAKPVADARLRIRVLFGDGAMIGPGKADLLELIRETGSIAAAARRMGMSYKRAWLLVETLNAAFAGPLVESSRGGAGHGGARLTEAGEEVLGRYRSLEACAALAATNDLEELIKLRRGDIADEQ